MLADKPALTDGRIELRSMALFSNLKFRDGAFGPRYDSSRVWPGFNFRCRPEGLLYSWGRRNHTISRNSSQFEPNTWTLLDSYQDRTALGRTRSDVRGRRDIWCFALTVTRFSVGAIHNQLRAPFLRHSEWLSGGFRDIEFLVHDDPPDPSVVGATGNTK